MPRGRRGEVAEDGRRVISRSQSILSAEHWPPGRSGVLVRSRRLAERFRRTTRIVPRDGDAPRERVDSASGCAVDLTDITGLTPIDQTMRARRFAERYGPWVLVRGDARSPGHCPPMESHDIRSAQVSFRAADGIDSAKPVRRGGPRPGRDVRLRASLCRPSWSAVARYGRTGRRALARDPRRDDVRQQTPQRA